MSLQMLCCCRASLGLQSKLLLKRSWRQIVRDKALNISRAMSNVSSAVIFGSIYWRLGRSQISIQDRMGLLQVFFHPALSESFPCDLR